LELSGGKEEQEWDLKNGTLLKCKAAGAPGAQDSPYSSSPANMAPVSIHLKEYQFCASAVNVF